MLFVAMVLLASLSIPVAAGEPVMTAELADHEVHNSFMESFAVRVNNPHLNDMDHYSRQHNHRVAGMGPHALPGV